MDDKELNLPSRAQDALPDRKSRSDIFRRLVPEYKPLIQTAQPSDLTSFRDRPLSRIHRLPKELRGEEFNEFKKKWISEHTKLANLQADLIEEIKEDPNISHQELMALLDNRRDVLHLTDEQYKIGRYLISAYVVRHDGLAKIAESYKNPEGSPSIYDDRRMFEDFFGVKPKGPVRVGLSPIAFYFECANQGDFARIEYLDLADDNTHKDESKLAQEAAAVENTLGIFRQDPVLIDRGLKGIVIAANLAVATSKKYDTSLVFIHEADHAMQYFFKTNLREILEVDYYKSLEEKAEEDKDKIPVSASLKTFTNYEDPDFGDVIDKCRTEEEKINLLRQYLVSERRYGERLAQDEILAYTLEGRDPRLVLKMRAKDNPDKPAYDFFDEDWIEKTVANYTDILGEEYEMQVRFLIAQVVKERYEEVVSTSIEAFEELTKNGYTTDQAINQLRMVPLRQWPKRVQRILEQK